MVIHLDGISWLKLPWLSMLRVAKQHICQRYDRSYYELQARISDSLSAPEPALPDHPTKQQTYDWSVWSFRRSYPGATKDDIVYLFGERPNDGIPF